MNTYLKNRANIWLLILFCVPFLLLNGCHEEDIPFIELSEEHIELGSTSGKKTIEVKTNGTWSAESDAQWCRVIKGSGSLYGSFELVIDANTTALERSANVVVKGTLVNTTLVVRQSPVDATLSLSTEEIVFCREAESYNINIFSNHQWSITSSSPWCSVDTDSGSKNGVVVISVAENNTSSSRKAQLTVSCEANGSVVTKSINITQTVDDYYLELPITDYKLDKESSILEVNYILKGASCSVEASSNVQWIEIASTNEGRVLLNIDENETGLERDAIVSVYTVGQSGSPIIKGVKISQYPTENILEMFFTDISLNPAGETVSFPVVTNSELTVRSSSEWCVVSVNENNVVVTADLNGSGSSREAIVTVETLNNKGKVISKAFKVKQAWLDVAFEFPSSEYEFKHSGDTRQIPLTATGDWFLANGDNIPAWLSVSPLSGTGTTNITIEASKNGFVSPRSFDLVFENELSGKTVVLTINQSSHPDIVLGDYKYLGMGYDAAGEYASDTWVRSQVLDWSKLEAADYVAGIIAPNSTEERYIYGKTIEEYQDNMTITAGVSGGFAGFTASVKTSYSEKTYTSTENEFASFRHITKKQSVKLDANVNAEQLRSCMTDVASQEINGTMAAADVIKKYGTHIISGFILGGSLDYSMTADVSSVSKEVDWKLAVEAGFQTASAGVSVSAGYEDYESMRTESSNFETRLYARGGESQYASGKGTEETFQEWLRSLSDPAKWVMVDYDGSKLIPIWMMASDATRRNNLEEEAKKYIEKGGIETITSHKTLQIESSNVVYLSTDNGGDAEIEFTLAIEIPNQKSVIFGNQTSEIKLSDESGEEYGLSYKSSEYSLSSYKQHIVKIEIKGRENDPGVDANDPFSRTIELIYNPTSGTWAYDGEKYNFSGKKWEAGQLNYDNNDYFWVLCTKDGTPTGSKEAVFKFRLKWF